MGVTCDLTHTHTKCRGDAISAYRFGPCERCGKKVNHAVCYGFALLDCGDCGGRMLRGRELSFYEYRREIFMETGRIKHKKAMLKQVTLTQPPDWDVYGSILRDWDKPEPEPGETRRPARATVTLTRRALAMMWLLAGILAVFAAVGLTGLMERI